MEFEMKNGLLIPKKSVTPIYVFIDETYLLHGTGFVQAAVPVPHELYSSTLVPLCRQALAELGTDAREFKGAGIKNGNKNVYLKFLRYFVNVAASLGDQADLHPIATVDAIAQYEGDTFKAIRDNVMGGLKNLGIENQENLLAAFSQQVLWLHHHWKKISNTRYANPLVLLFDNKHRYAQQFDERVLHVNRQLIAPVFWELGKTMTSVANTLFERLEPVIPISRINRFDFQRSEKEFGIQAADLLSHLLYSAVKYEMGIRDGNNNVKYWLLRQVMPGFACASELRAALRIVKDAEGKDGLECVDAKLLSTFQLLPVPRLGA